MECSVALLRMYLYNVKFISDLCWLDCDLWTISGVLSTSIAVELKIEICNNPSVMASWFISLSILSEEVWSPFIAFLTHLNFCSEIYVQKSKNLVFSWVFSVSSKVHVGFLIKRLTSAMYSLIWCISGVLESALRLVIAPELERQKMHRTVDTDLPGLFRASR